MKVISIISVSLPRVESGSNGIHLFFSFEHLHSSSQLIHGIISAGFFPPIYLSVICASNYFEERKSLWNLLVDSVPPRDQPWVILGDFNCCRSNSEKASGSLLPNSRLGELNNMIFNCGVHDLSSTGLFYTWFNQRVDNPIHIKLDRVLVNSSLLDYLPTAYYQVVPPLGSDHSPLIFKSLHDKPISARFMFKNYWVNMEGYWDDVLEAFSLRTSRSPIASFYHSLHSLKGKLKNRSWASSSYLSASILALKDKQHQCLLRIQEHPLDLELNHNLKSINDELASLQTLWTS
ncbi:hypothetical protein MA16_Dca008485 [Dendrobium catenatum]|uniref:Endonuclease/exonuclease/phosphatase domain-containing protein n=1 Tax=Dendrobium catenatum TaxID=906689 RepID=A0A2I0XHL1_9ASPA|nr:hypothetical protein MA16_Dca008485 [Dendrobium catenatum]